MHEMHKIEKKLRKDAERISQAHGGATVIVIVGGLRKRGSIDV